MRNEFWVEVYYETRSLKLSNFLWFLKCETSDSANGDYSKGSNSLFLWNDDYSISVLLKNEFQNVFRPVWLAFHFARDVLILKFFFLNWNWW